MCVSKVVVECEPTDLPQCDCLFRNWRRCRRRCRRVTGGRIACSARHDGVVFRRHGGINQRAVVDGFGLASAQDEAALHIEWKVVQVPREQSRAE